MEISGIIALFLSVIISRIINEKGYRSLTSEEKVCLMDGFSKSRAYSMIPMLVLIGVYYLLMSRTSLDKGILTLSYFCLLVAYVIVRIVFNHKKLLKINMPKVYLRYFTIAQIVSVLGVAWFFYVLFAQKFGL